MAQAQNLTIDEIIERIDSLSDEDYLRLANTRRAWAIGIRGWGPDDLFHEALERLLQGSRHAPSNLSFVFVVLEIMRSLADERRKQQAKYMLEVDDDELDVGGGQDMLERLIQEEVLVELQHRVGNDNTATEVLKLRAQGYGPDEICSTLAIKRTTYDSANKRIRRAVLKHSQERSNA